VTAYCIGCVIDFKGEHVIRLNFREEDFLDILGTREDLLLSISNLTSNLLQ